MVDPYERLGVPNNASLAQIRKAYRQLALKYHPDKLNPSKPMSLEEQRYAAGNFAEINAAYGLLMNPEAKRRLDQKLFGQNNNCQGFSPKNTTEGYNSRSYTYPRGAAPVIFQFKGPLKDIVGKISLPKFCTEPTFSSRQTNTTSTGARQYVQKTTHFHQGKPFTRIQTTTIHKDGRREVKIQEDGNPTQRHSTHISNPLHKQQQATNHDIKQTFVNHRKNNNHYQSQRQRKPYWYENMYDKIINSCTESSSLFCANDTTSVDKQKTKDDNFNQ